MRKFFLTARPGCDMYSAIENPDYSHSEILEVDTDGTILGHIPFMPDTEFMYDPEPDPSYSKPQVVVTAEGEIEIPTLVPENKIATGENPFIQLIYRFVKKSDGATEEDILRHMTMEKKYLPNDETGIKRTRAYIKVMYKGSMSGLLLMQGENYVVGLKLRTGRHLVAIHSGYDPIEYQIMRHIENKGLSSRDEIHRMLIDRLKWIKKGSTVEHYIDKIIKDKLVKKVSENWFEFKNMPELIK